MTKKKSTKERVLFPEKKVYGYTIKPWTLGMIEELVPSLERIAIELIKRRITTKNYKEQGLQIIPAVIPELSEIISKTLGIPIKEVKEFQLDEVTVIVLTIAEQNMKYLKNSLSPITKLMTTMMSG